MSGLVRGRSVNVTNDIEIPRITTNGIDKKISVIDVESNLLQTNIQMCHLVN